MRCPDPACQAAIRPQDRHCPRCGRPLSLAPSPALPPSASAQFHVTPSSLPTVPVAETGEAYPALRQRAQVSIVAAGVLRWVFLGLGAILFVLSSVSGYKLGVLWLGLGVGFVFLIAGGVIGYLLWLRYAVFGEMIYLVLDLAAIFRRK